VTGEHPVYLPDHGHYAAAESLGGGERLLALGPSGTQSAISEGFTLGAGPLTETVYNITVEGVHNYFAAGVLVHNKSGGGPACLPEATGLSLSHCSPAEGCIDPLAPSDEHVTLNQPVASLEPELPVDGGANGGAPVPPAVFGSYHAQLCQPPQPDQVVLIAFDTVSAAPYFTVSLYSGNQACGGASIGEVWLGDHDPPLPGVRSTQCVSVRADSLGEWLTVLGPEEGTVVDNVRFVSGCDCVRRLKQWTTCGLDPNGAGGSSACE
jgi:hypothetical protein